MAAITFPSKLQAQIPASSVSRSPGENFLETEMEQGDPKYRALQQAVPDNYEFDVWLYGRSEENLLFDFYKNTCKGSVNLFNWTNPYTDVAIEVRFSAPPETRVKGDNTGTVFIGRCQIKTAV